MDYRKGRKMYTFIKFLSVIIRTFYLPNPFEPLDGKFSFECMGVNIPITADLINMYADVLLVPLAFLVTSLYYTKGEDSPVKGSILFLLFYSIHIGLIWILSLLEFNIWAVIGVVVIYAYILNCVNLLKEKIFYGGD